MSSLHNYIRDEGESYFLHQNRGGLRQGKLEARKFGKYIFPEDIVLDFGCGSGNLLYHIACKDKIGVEINPIAREEVKKNGIKVYESLNEVEESDIDIVISNHALEHVDCPLMELSKIFNLLSNKGQLIVYVPLDDWRAQKKIDLNDQRHHLYTWTPQLLYNLFSEVGFVVDDVWVDSHIWPSYWRVIDKLFPLWIFDLICKLNSIFMKRRQIGIIAHKSVDDISTGSVEE